MKSDDLLTDINLSALETISNVQEKHISKLSSSRFLLSCDFTAPPDSTPTCEIMYSSICNPKIVEFKVTPSTCLGKNIENAVYDFQWTCAASGGGSGTGVGYASNGTTQFNFGNGAGVHYYPVITVRSTGEFAQMVCNIRLTGTLKPNNNPAYDVTKIANITYTVTNLCTSVSMGLI